MTKLTPVDFDPFAPPSQAGPRLTPVDFDPFAPAAPKPTAAMPANPPLPPARPADLDTGLNIPEPPETIAAQQAQVGKGTGTGARSAVMFPQGSDEPDLPEDWSRIVTPRGVFHYDPSKIRAAKIRELSAAGRENEILGLGPVSKPEADKRIAKGETPVTIVERQPDGTEVKAAVGTPTTAEKQVAALEKGKLPGSVIDVEQPLSTAMRRVAKNPPIPPVRPADLGGVPAPEAQNAPDTTPAGVLTGDEQTAHIDTYLDTRPDNPWGDKFGMLTPREGLAQKAEREAGATTGVEDAAQRLVAAQERAALLANLPRGARGSQSELQRQAIESELASAQAAFDAAQKGLETERANPAPSMTATASALSGAAKRAAEMPVGAIGGLGRPIDAVLGTDIGGMADRERERTEKAFPTDPARAQDFVQQLGEGAGSMVGFIMGGAIGRAAGVSQKATSMGIGGFQNADEMYREADKAKAGAWKKAMAYIAGGAVGMTEGFGSGRLLDHLAGIDKATNGGVRRYFGLILQQKGEEGLQEAVQSLGNDLAKLGVLGIDPGDMTVNAAQNALLGAILGGATAGIIGAPVAFSGPGRQADEAAAEPAQPSQNDTVPPVVETASPAQLEEIPQTGETFTPDQNTSVPPAPSATPGANAGGDNAPAPLTPATPQDDGANRVLRAAGYSDEDISDMSPPERQAALDEARAEGVEPGPAPIVADQPAADGPAPGTRKAPVSVTSEADMEGVRSVVNTEPTEGQKAAGNYQKGHVRFEGLDLSIENPKGSTRSGTDPDGETWNSVLPADYGYIKGTRGADGDPVDIFVGPKGAVGAAYVIEQIDPKTGKFDEIKVITGVETRGEAITLYEGAFSDGSGAQRWSAITPMSAADLKEWLIDKKGGRAPVPKRYRDKPQTQAAPKGEGWREIGKNADGNPVFEDERGVRSFVESGVRVTETVGVIPGGGVVVKAPGERGTNYLTVEEQADADANADPVVDMTPRPPRDTGPKGPVSLVSFLRSLGGLKDEGGELRARDMHKRHPGLVSRNGMELDKAREAAAEAGYLRPGRMSEGAYNDAAVATTTINDLLDALDNHPTYRAQDEQAVAERDEDRAGAEIARRIEDAKADIRAYLESAGVTEQATDPRYLQAAAEGVIAGDTDTENAYEWAVLQAWRDNPNFESEARPYDAEIEWGRIDPIPFPVGEIRAQASSQANAGGDRAPATPVQEGDEQGRGGEGETGRGRADEAPAASAETRESGEARPAGQVADDPATPVTDEAAEAQAAPEGVKNAELGQIVAEFNDAQQRALEGEQITHVFDPPKKGEIVRLDQKVQVYHRDHGWMSVEDAKARVEEWKAHAAAQGKTGTNADKIVLSLFDLTGQWSQPWEDAGYQVYRFDIQAHEDQDVLKFGVDYFADNFGMFEGGDVYAILAACPCTDFAVSGAKHFAAKDADGRTIKSVEIVHRTLATIEYFKPSVWAVENPVGRIEKLGGLPPWRSSWNPNHFADPYTKRTLLWGRFNADMPIAPVEPTEGSKMWSQFGGKSQATKNARSETPEGFAYAFFMANNAIDHPVMALANKYDRLDRGAIEAAVNAGLTDKDVSDLVDDFYYIELDDAAANKALREAAKGEKPVEPTTEKGADGKDQLVVPGAEKIGDGKLAQMKADAPLKPKAEQKDPGGLFSDSMDQADLLDMASAPKVGEAPAAADQFADVLRETRYTDKPAARGPDGRGWRIKKDEQHGFIVLRMPNERGKPPTYFRPGANGTTWTVDEAVEAAQRYAASFPAVERTEPAPATDSGEKQPAQSNPVDWSARGAQDFAEGKNSTPPADVRAAGMDALDAWVKAWHRANASQPVPGVTDSPEWTGAEPAPASENTVVEAFRHHFASPEGSFRTIVEARKFARENGFKPVDGVPENKQIEELIEHALVLAARDIVAASKGRGAEVTYQRLVDLYNRQPKLGSRTSASVAEQAYSTPMPLAYLASRIAGITGETTVLEPTAGNGALLIEADPKKAVVNELNPVRAKNLDGQGFSPMMGDATDPEAFKQQRGKMQVVIANPPFGAVREGGESKVWKLDGFATTNIDHAISLRALETMAPDGRAVLIIGGVKAESEKERSKGYMGSAKRKFFFRLMKDYNVTDIFTVDGGLYERQGAGWPVDVIVIEGKGQSARKPPSADVPRLFKSWGELKEKLDGHGYRQGASGPRSVVGQDGVPAAGPADAGGRPGSDDGLSGVATDGGRPADGRPAAQQPPELGAQPSDGQSPDLLGEQRPDDVAVDRPGDVRDGRRTDPEPDSDRVEVNATGQAPYRSASQRGVKLGTLVPANLATVTRDSLNRVEARQGAVDEYVARELGYKIDELGQYFSAEQIDAIALAMDNIEKGAGFIIGDQTGIGKGRVVAAAIRYAHKKGMVPLFVTEKPDLYGDMWRDLHDIGFDTYLGRPIEMFMTNSGTRVPLDDEAVTWSAERDAARDEGEKPPPQRGTFSTPQDTKKAAAKMRQVLSGEYKPDVVFTTYDQMNSVKGQETERRAFLRSIAPRAFLIMDETHNAGGQGQDGGWEAKDKAPPRSKLFREAVDAAQAVLYSSATYAKSPKVMDLFSRTDMSLAVEDRKKLPEFIAKGGVPLQQAVSSMLARSGQYMRRERSFEGIAYEMETAPVDEQSYAQFSQALREIFRFDLAFGPDRQEIAEQIAAEMGAGKARDDGTGEGGAQATAFASIMHNAINQMVLSIKARAAGQRAIQALKDGEKPVIALSSTMESFIKDFADDTGINVGDEVTIDFGDVLKRYLVRTRRVTIKMGDDTKQHVMIQLGQMPSDLADAYQRVEAFLNTLDFSHMPISPIDYIRNEIARAGYSVREITGRENVIDYSGNAPTYADRPKSEQGVTGKRVSIKDFNDGKLDVLILNKSGSTGVSLHAKKGYKDVRKRRMILVQADPNIDTHMQMLGRTNRTGQVVLPAYTQLMADIPAEARPAAVLLKKMASLNANTTAARKGALSGDSVDFINEYGDAVVAQVLDDDPETNAALGYPLKDSDGTKKIEGLAAKATGKLPLLAPADQQAFLDRVTDAYTKLIETLDAAGENKLEAKSVDLQAITEETTTLKPAEGPSPFQAAVELEKVSVKSQGRAMAPDEVLEATREALGLKEIPTRYGATEGFTRLAAVADEGRRKAADLIKRTKEEHDQHKRAVLGGLKDPDAKTRAESKENAIFDRWESIASLAHIGRVIEYESAQGGDQAVVIGFSRAPKAKNPLALSAWQLTLAVPNSSRTIGIPLSQVYTSQFPKPEDAHGLTISVPWQPQRYEQLGARFEEARKEGRETRYIATGNLLAGYEQMKGKGQIITYTKADGQVQQGIIMARTFDPKDFFNERGVRFRTGAQVIQFIGQAPSGEVTSTDGIITIRKGYTGGYRGGLEFDRPAAKGKGGVYFTDRAVRDVFDAWEKRGSRMRATVDESTAARLIDAMMSLEAVFEARDQQDIARGIVGEKAPETKKADPPPRAMAALPRLTPQAEAAGLDLNHIADIISEIVGRVAGPGVNIELTGKLTVRGEEASGLWDGTRNLLSVALGSRDKRNTAYHEAFHALQSFGAFSPQEIAVMEREAPRHRAMIRGWWERMTRGQQQFPADLPVGETSAYTFGFYAEARDRGESVSHLHIGVRRAFDKALAILRRIQNYFAGLGFQTSEDIFERARTGAYRNVRNPAASWDTPDQAARFWDENPGQRPMAAVPQKVQNDRGRMTGFIENVADRFVRIRELQNQFRRDAKIPNVPDVHRALGAMDTRIAARVEDVISDELNPLLDLIEAAGGEARVHRYLYVRHAQERNEYIAQFNPAMPDGGSGIDTATAQAELATFQAAPDFAALDAAAQAIDAMIDRDLDVRLAAGLYSQDQVDALRDMFEHYVPLRGFESDEFEKGTPLAGVGISVARRESPIVKGRKSLADSIIAHTVLMRTDGIARAEKNRVDMMLFRLAQMMEAHYGAATPMKARVKPPLIRVGGSGAPVMNVPDPAYERQANVVTGKIGGKLHYVEFVGEPNLVEQLKNQMLTNDDVGTQWVGSLTRAMGRMWTVYNPLFAPVNTVRDLLDASTAATALIGEGGVRAYTSNIPRGIIEATKATFGYATPDFERFRHAGARMSWAKIRNLDEIERHVSDRLDGWKLTNAHRKAFHPIAVALEGWNDIFENAHRFALFKAAIDKGLPEAQAVKAALEGTLNFNRRGSGGLVRVARIIYPFMNPSIQAPLRAARLIQEAGGLSTAQGKKQAAKAVVRGLTKTYLAFQVAGVAIGVLNYALGGEDDDGIPFWDKAQWNPQSQKNIIIYTGGRDEKGRPNAVMIPAFPEIMLPLHMGNALAASIFGKMSAKEIAQTVGRVAANLSPTEGRGAVPAIVAPIYEIYANKNHFGGPVHPNETPYTRGVPKPERKFSTTDENWQAVARAFGAMGLNLHPEDYRHVARSYLGGWYQIADAIAEGTGATPPTSRVNLLARRWFIPGERGVDGFERAKFDEGQGKANEKRAGLQRRFDDPTALDDRERRRARRDKRDEIEAAGGSVGPRGGIVTTETQIFDTGRQVMSALAKRREAEIAKATSPAEKAAIRQNYTDQIAAARKRFRRMADDLGAGRIPADEVRGLLRDARIEARNPD